MDARSIVGEVATVVGLAEGVEGVRDVVRTIARHEPVAVRRISRATDLPVPFVAAICNELRKRGVVSPLRPVQLTPAGRAAFGAATRRGALTADDRVQAARRLAELARVAPEPRVELDQVHCTADTKLRRVLAMDEAGVLDDRSLLLLGDDDLLSLTVALLAREQGIGAALRELVVVDVDPRLVDLVARGLADAPFAVECVTHDLREPLPERLHGRADTVFTDPPYTGPGAALFLSRAAEATAGRAGRDVFLAFGPKRPDETLELQRAIAAMGFAVQRLTRNFNDYVGAGSLGGTSHLYHLATTSELRPLTDGRYDGPLYTGDFRTPSHDYRCRGCGRIQRVGRGLTWATIEALRRDGCLRCGGRAFVPLPRDAARRARTSAPAGTRSATRSARRRRTRPPS